MDGDVSFTAVKSCLLFCCLATAVRLSDGLTRESGGIRSHNVDILPSLPPHRPTQQIQRWASCRLSPLHWPQVRTPARTCTRNPPTPPSPRTPPRTANVRAAAAVEAKGATPSLTPAPCLHRHLPPRSTPPLPQSHLCSTAELPKKNP